MQRKRNIQLIILLVILSITTGAFIFLDPGDVESIDKNMFRQADLSHINRIAINKQSEQIDITFDGTRWKVDGQLADQNMVEVLFATLQQAEPKRQVAASIADSLNQQMELNGIRVSLYADEELQEKFIVLGSTNKSITYFKLAESDQSYMVTIPGYRVYVAGIFELDQLGWKDKLAFNLNWRNFKGVKVDFTDHPDESFEVGFGPGKYFTILDEKSVDTTRLNDFLDAASYLTVDQYTPPEQSIENQAPAMTITIEDVSGKKYSLEIFESSGTSGQRRVIIGTDQFALISNRKLSDLMKPKSWFTGSQ